jgi:zinc protease
MKPSQIVLPPVHTEQLPNGVTVLAAERPGVPLASARLVVRAGSSLDPAGRFGAANLVAEAARRGTHKRTGKRIDEEVEALGAELGTGTDEDATSFGFSAPVESLAKLLDVVIDVATDPVFPAQEFQRLKRRELASMVHDMDEPAAVADRAMLWAAYGSHPYGHPIEGTARHISALSRAQAIDFHHKRYGPASTVLVLVGALDLGRALDLARAKIGRWRAPAAPARDPDPPAACPRRVICVDKPELTQSQVRIATPALPRSSPQYFPAVVASSVFGGGFTSRLMDAVRVNRGLSYSVRGRFAMSRSAGLFAMASFTKNETVVELIEVLLGEAKKFCDSGPSQDELERTQSYVSGLYPLTLETHDQIADKLADTAVYGVPIEQVIQYRERVREVTAEQCREVACSHFPVEQGAIVVVGPAKQLARSLERFGPVTVLPARRFA